MNRRRAIIGRDRVLHFTKSGEPFFEARKITTDRRDPAGVKTIGNVAFLSLSDHGGCNTDLSGGCVFIIHELLRFESLPVRFRSVSCLRSGTYTKKSTRKL